MQEKKLRNFILNAQKNEISEYYIYKKLSRSTKDLQNKIILENIANEELKHYDFWKSHSGKEIKPNRLKIWFFFIIATFFGLTFSIRLMERGEESAQQYYDLLVNEIPDLKRIITEEEQHEEKLISMINEEFLEYTGSIVLGLSDALVELTGVLSGLTLALQDIKLILLTGGVTGIAAALSMAASEYLSTSEEGGKSAFKASLYTGTAYLFTVAWLFIPYFILSDPIMCLLFVIINAIILICITTFYISVAKNMPFKKKFFKITSITIGVSVFTFILGHVVRTIWKIEI